MSDITIDRLIRSQRKSIALVVTADATLVVRAPLHAPMILIEKLVYKKRVWINNKITQALHHAHSRQRKEFVTGEQYLFLGQRYPLKVASCKRILLDGYLFLPEKYLLNARTKIIAWYKREARTKISERAGYFSRLTGWQYRSLAINSAETRWGSCGPNGSLNFSWKLIMAPLAIIDYVVVHELAHLAEKNHSQKFWNKVQSVLPDYKIRKKWFRDNRVDKI